MKPYVGKQLWIWELPFCENGNPAAIVAKAKDLGLTGLIVKAWDSYHYWTQFDQVVEAAHKAGLLVAAWGYSRAQFIPGEVQAMETALHAGADWFVIDAEVEYEKPTGAALATELLEAIFRSRVKNATIGFSTFDLPQEHPGFPYEVFAKRCHVFLPQIYWADRNQQPAEGLRNSLVQSARFAMPIAPTGDAYGKATAEQVKAFGEAVKAAGLPGVNYWSWQHATPEIFEAIKGIQF